MSFAKRREGVVIVDPVLEHLRRRLDEVPFGRDAGLREPALGAAEDAVEHMAEFVEEGLDVAVLHQPGGVIALGRFITSAPSGDRIAVR